MIVETLVVGPLQVNCYLVSCPETHEALVIDAGDDAVSILQRVEQGGLQVVRVVNTHGHFDHQGAVRQVVEATGAPFYLHRADLPLIEGAEQHAALYDLATVGAPAPDGFLDEGDRLTFGRQTLQVRLTPGHSPGGVSLVGEGVVFTGDSLFAGSIGRTDLPLGDHQQLLHSIREQLLSLPDETLVYPGHGPQTTIGRERRANPFLC